MERVSIDESSLLSETEDLLATLDAAAFVQSSKLPPLAPSPYPHGRDASAASTISSNSLRYDTAAAAPPQKESRRQELHHLRRVAAELESQLALLQQQSRSYTFVRDKRAQIWQELAMRQRRVRELAERDNAELKAIMDSLLRAPEGDAQHLQRYLDSRSALTHLPNHWHGTRKLAASPAHSTAATSAFESVLAQLDAHFAQVDAVFRESGMNVSLTEPRSFAEKRARRLGVLCPHFQLTDVRLTPFDWRAVAQATWSCNRAWYMKDSAVTHASADRPESTLAVRYRVAHPTLGETQSATVTLAIRQYVQADRAVCVLVNECDGEQDLAGATASCVGFLVIQSVDLALDARPAPVAVIQSCMQLVPGQHDASAKDHARALVRLISSAFEEDVAHMRQRVDTALLQASREQTRQSECPPLVDASVPCIAFSD